MKINNLFIIDINTTGPDIEKDEVIEIAGLVLNVPTLEITMQVSTVVPVETNKESRHTSIPVYATRVSPFNKEAIKLINYAADTCDYVLSYDGNITRQWLEIFNIPDLMSKKWINGKSQIEFEFDENPSSLPDLCAKMNVPMIGCSRALDKASLFAKCLQKTPGLENKLLMCVILKDENKETKEEEKKETSIKRSSFFLPSIGQINDSFVTLNFFKKTK